MDLLGVENGSSGTTSTLSTDQSSYYCKKAIKKGIPRGDAYKVYLVLRVRALSETLSGHDIRTITWAQGQGSFRAMTFAPLLGAHGHDAVPV